MSKSQMSNLSFFWPTIGSVLEGQFSQAKVLSLDCFDTLLWRTAAEPTDVFKDLQNLPLFKTFGINSVTRKHAEQNVRKLKSSLDGCAEITIEEIYEYILQTNDPTVISPLVNAELEAEKRYLFPFKPMFDLLVKAKKKGLKTMIVSDMYISAAQLRVLVEHAANKIGVRPVIDHYFTSSQFRTTKSRELFQKISKKVGIPTAHIIHAGDNKYADLLGARRQGVHGFHFQRFPSQLEHFMRHNRTMQKVLSNDHVDSVPATTSWHAEWAQLPETTNILEMIGWYSLGPVMVNFCQWLAQEANEAAVRTGKRPKLVFMMRDGHLPHETLQILKNKELDISGFDICSLDISRFSALTLHFDTEKSIKEFVALSKGKLHRMEIVRQLTGRYDPQALLPELDCSEEIPWEMFANTVMNTTHIESIIANARQCREMFLKYVEDQLQPQIGDLVLLADLGYTGTIQNLLQPILEAQWAITTQGLYLILKEGDRAQHHRKGLIDYREINAASVQLLLSQIQTLEQLSSNDNGSVVSYGGDRKPIYEDNLLSANQRLLKVGVQRAALDFAATHGPAYIAQHGSFDRMQLEVLGLLGRMLLMPTKGELELCALFTHDINNGTTRKRMISNPRRTQLGLKSGGMMSFDNDYHKMFANDLNLFDPSLTFLNFAKSRFELNLNVNDFKDSGVDLHCVIERNGSFDQIPIPCFFTHDGYRIGLVKRLAGAQAIGINFGKTYTCIQVGLVSLVSWQQFNTNPHWAPLTDLTKKTRLIDASWTGHGLCEFNNEDGFLYVTLPEQLPGPDGDCVFAFVFRPIANRTTMPPQQ